MLDLCDCNIDLCCIEVVVSWDSVERILEEFVVLFKGEDELLLVCDVGFVCEKRNEVLCEVLVVVVVD